VLLADGHVDALAVGCVAVCVHSCGGVWFAPAG
jgi:hypothetical protein